MRKSKLKQPWWLEEGTEICPACGHTYVIQTEYRCVECDEKVCVECVQSTGELDVVCPGCVPAAATMGGEL